MSTDVTEINENEFDDDFELADDFELDKTDFQDLNKNKPNRNARQKIEDYLERKRMREILEDDFDWDIDE